MSSASLYPYAEGDVLDNPHTYFFSDYGGRDFVAAWWRKRSAVLAILGPARAAPQGRTMAEITSALTATAGSVRTAPLLDHLFAAISAGKANAPDVRQWLMRLVQKFEVSKHVHPGYREGFRALDSKDFYDLGLYLRLGEVLEAAYDATADLRFLNTFLKCMDTLCARAAGLDAEQGGRLATLIGRERRHVQALGQAKGVEVCA